LQLGELRAQTRQRADDAQVAAAAIAARDAEIQRLTAVTQGGTTFPAQTATIGRLSSAASLGLRESREDAAG
jgi:hypothetical protein